MRVKSGSRTTPQMGAQLRKAAATAREALVEIAAKNWNTTSKGLTVENGMVINTAANKRIGYGELTKGQQLLMTISDKIQVVAASDWKVAGKPVPKVNGESFITGKHSYVSDMKLPGMLYGKILRAPSYKAKVLEADVTKARAIPGVIVVQDGDFIGVAAPDVKTAGKALQAINARWGESTGQPSNENIFDYLVKKASGESSGRNSGTVKGNVEEGLASADFTHSKTYNIHYIAHVPHGTKAALA